MHSFDKSLLKKLALPTAESHKGQNGKLMIIGGSHLFHGASLWALKVATRIVDMVFFASSPENVEYSKKLKSEVYDFIAVPKEQIENYIQEADAVLIGPGLPREEGRMEGEEKTKELVERLITRYSQKKWVIDAGALTEMNPDLLLQLQGNAVLTPHPKEFKTLFGTDPTESSVLEMAKKYSCILLLKGEVDTICSPQECVSVAGGNAGMTKGGTGDVLAGLVAALSCRNELFLSAVCASYVNKKAGERLFKRVGYYFNATDLSDEIPKVMKEELLT